MPSSRDCVLDVSLASLIVDLICCLFSVLQTSLLHSDFHSFPHGRAPERITEDCCDWVIAGQFDCVLNVTVPILLRYACAQRKRIACPWPCIVSDAMATTWQVASASVEASLVTVVRLLCVSHRLLHW